MRDLRPLATCRRIKELALVNTLVTDLHPLLYQEHLHTVDLRNTLVEDICPLVTCPLLRILGVYVLLYIRVQSGKECVYGAV